MTIEQERVKNLLGSLPARYLADELGVTEQTIHNKRNGRSPWNKRDRIVLAKTLNTTEAVMQAIMEEE